ncbi:hypothetical protein [Methylocystis bryophila]|uniref:hypothetical protein n=1 Tax=Methylocystis bryophila TaxID=655015 RepID=UPI001319D25F|nr:hypothetical protein [Methylocystis bryophila]BDV38972.1 hypothetical protein DSM21852_22250 [Methylocystis bryophila]
MSVFSRKTAIALTCATVLGGFAATPSVAGVITPADKETVAAESPLDFVGWRRICHYHCHWAWRPSHRCVVAADYPRYGWCHRRHYCDYTPVYVVTYPAWDWGWGGGWGWGGLFPFL